MHSCHIYSICRPPKVIVRSHKIVLNYLYKKRPTYLPKLKLMGMSTAKLYILKDDLVKPVFYFRTKSLLSGSPTELVVLTRLLEPGQFLMKFSVVFLLGAL